MVAEDQLQTRATVSCWYNAVVLIITNVHEMCCYMSLFLCRCIELPSMFLSFTDSKHYEHIEKQSAVTNTDKLGDKKSSLRRMIFDIGRLERIEQTVG